MGWARRTKRASGDGRPGTADREGRGRKQAAKALPSRCHAFRERIWKVGQLPLPVHRSAVPDADNQNDKLSVLDVNDYAVVSNSVLLESIQRARESLSQFSGIGKR